MRRVCEVGSFTNITWVNLAESLCAFRWDIVATFENYIYLRHKNISIAKLSANYFTYMG